MFAENAYRYWTLVLQYRYAAPSCACFRGLKRSSQQLTEASRGWSNTGNRRRPAGRIASSISSPQG